MRRRGRTLRRRYGRAARMDTPYFKRVAESFLHPIVVREALAAGKPIVSERDVHELTGVLERVATHGREGR